MSSREVLIGLQSQEEEEAQAAGSPSSSRWWGGPQTAVTEVSQPRRQREVPAVQPRSGVERRPCPFSEQNAPVCRHCKDGSIRSPRVSVRGARALRRVTSSRFAEFLGSL